MISARVTFSSPSKREREKEMGGGGGVKLAGKRED